jgi:hypothetical protein
MHEPDRAEVLRMSYQIRAHTYHGEAGYLLSGRANGAGGWPISIFFLARDAAERWRAKLKTREAHGRRFFGSVHDFESLAVRHARVVAWQEKRPARLKRTPAPYMIAPARYARGQVLITCTPDGSGWKTRAMRLAGDGLRGRFSGREHGYIVSPSKAAKFERLYALGWDASAVTGELQPPENVTTSTEV